MIWNWYVKIQKYGQGVQYKICYPGVKLKFVEEMVIVSFSEGLLSAKSGRSAKPIIMQHFYKSMGDLL